MKLVKGRVIKSTGSWYKVKIDGHQIIEARIKGKFRVSEINTTNPIAVGDWVDIEQSGTEFLIKTLHERQNYLIRKSIKLSKQRHIIASNIDQLLIIVTLENPFTSNEFIDRVLCTAEAFHLKVVLVLNKIDLPEITAQKLNDFITVYENIGYQCLKTSAKTGENLSAFKNLLKNKTTLISGHSGCGKSSLLNAIDENLHLKTSEISDAFKTGKHTTTFAEMHSLSIGGDVIDTPGVKAFGVIEIPPEEVSHYFIEMRELLPYCKFNNCQHIDEPNCAVKNALETGHLALSRYKSYLSILLEEKNHFRVGP